MSGAFCGDFDALPMAAALYYSMPPEYPTEADIQGAMLDASNADPFTTKGAAAYWKREAVRFRRYYPGCPLNDGLRVIARETAKALGAAQKRGLGE